MATVACTLIFTNRDAHISIPYTTFEQGQEKEWQSNLSHAVSSNSLSFRNQKRTKVVSERGDRALSIVKESRV